MITKFYVHNLYGMYKNTLEIDNDSNITIILGPNGCGKTTMLVMFEAILSFNHLILKNYRFDYLELLVDNKVLKIENTLYNNNQDRKSPLIYYIDGEKVDMDLMEGRRLPLSLIRDFMPGIRRIAQDLYIDRYNNKMTYREVVEEVYDSLPERLQQRFVNPLEALPTEVADILRKYKDKAYFISTNRITMTIKGDDIFNEEKIQNSIQVYSDELKALLKNELTEYANKSQKLDEEFPSKVIQAIKNKNRLSIDDLKENFDKINKLRNKIILSGVLEQNTANWIDVDMASIDNSTKSMLTIYYSDTEKKLQTLSDVVERLTVFLSMVNKKLGDKKHIKVNSTNGIQVFLDNDKENPIDLNKLSSGEQQEIILLYQLVFKATNKQFILLDEPEISLHVAWQRQFIDDIKSIIKLNNYTVLISTHSPQIINDNWNLVNKLGEVD